jgi:hypothetical protein
MLNQLTVILNRIFLIFLVFAFITSCKKSQLANGIPSAKLNDFKKKSVFYCSGSWPPVKNIVFSSHG